MTALGERQLTRGQLIWPLLCVFAFFTAFSFLRMPVPAPNEPHYLAKAKHYWDAAYCPGDFFLDSANTHRVFYQTFGWVTRFLTLPQAAVIGRVVSLLLLASGWTIFTIRLVPNRWGPVGAAALFLAIEAIGNFSGEWVVGGVEGKVFSYAFVFCGMASCFDRRWILTGLCFGLSVAFHPVVGIWAVAAAIFASVVISVIDRSRWHSVETANADGRPVWHIAMALAVFALTSLPGIIPALEVVGKAPEQVQRLADFIVVSYRLKHHLDPMDFSKRQYVEYGLLLCVWHVSELCWRKRGGNDVWFRWFVVGAILIAVAGLIIGFGERPFAKMPYYEIRMKLLKFYPFRLADVFIPVACAIGIVRFVVGETGDREPRFFQKTGFLQLVDSNGFRWFITVGAMAFALTYPAPLAEFNSSRMSAGKKSDWQAACRWIAEKTPADALFLTPTHSWAFKWHAQRAEYVSLKDCPQDAAGVVEWNRRLLYRTKWIRRNFDEGYSASALKEFQQATGVTHMLSSRSMNVPLQPLYENSHFSVYRLSDL